MTGYHFGKRIDHGNQRPVQVVLIQTGAVKQGTVGCPVNPVNQFAASIIAVLEFLGIHGNTSSFFFCFYSTH